jgi:molybdate transport system substrate-binding protein
MKFVAGVFLVALPLMLLHAGPANAQSPAGPKDAAAKPPDLRVIATAALRDPLDAVLAQARQVAGHPIVVEYGSARGNLKDKILGGADFEVALLLPDVNEELLKHDKILPESHEIARVNVGIGLRGDAPDVDVSTPAALKKAMLNARSIRYAPTGAAILTVRKVLATFGIAHSIKDSSRERGQVELGPHEYELNFYPLSEIIPNKAMRNLGAVTAELQVPVIISAVVGKHASDVKAARALVAFLKGPAIDRALAASGMIKGAAAQ